MADSSFQWAILLALTTLCLALTTLIINLSRYATAYMAAPREVSTFIDTVYFSIQENEGYDRDVAKVAALEDKMRLFPILREIQKGGDDLREELNGLLMEDTTTLKTWARLLWAERRSDLEDRVRRLDMLRMRFLVVYMGIMSGGAVVNGAVKTVNPTPAKKVELWEKALSAPVTPVRLLPKGLAEGIGASVTKKREPMRRLTTPAMGHKNETAGGHKLGWLGVIKELQRSPKMQQRHATIETAMMEEKSTSP